jgi:hypothetical protein
MSRFVCSCVVLCGGTSIAGAAEPFLFTRDLPILARAQRVDADYTGDGTNELMAWWSPFARQQLIDGRSGAVLRSWTGLTGVAPEFALLPDTTSDGRKDFLFTVPQAGRVFAVSSASPGGELSTIPTLWEVNGPGDASGLGENIAVTTGAQPRALIASSSRGRVLVTNPVNGNLVARLSRDPSTLDVSGFGSLVADAGDLNADGVHDFAIGAPGRYANSDVSSEGRIYFVDGQTTTSHEADTPVSQLPSVLGMVRSTTKTSLGLGGTHVLANLGDPRPNNGVAETLLLAGVPHAEFNVGGAIATLLTHPQGNPLAVQTVAEWVNDTPYQLGFGSDVQHVGDITGDGVGDAAILEPADGSHIRRGRILILDGAALLDGFQTGDVLQEITDPARSFSRNSLRFLGDYDGNGWGDLAVTTSGPEQSVRIYTVVPEPGVSATIFMTVMMLARRRRHLG